MDDKEIALKSKLEETFGELPFICTNKKTKNIYLVKSYAINATNSNDGQLMVVYERLNGGSKMIFTREIEEFCSKFSNLNIN